MTMTCTVCRRPDRTAIEAERGRGVPAREIAQDRGISEDAVYRHSKHAAAAILQAKGLAELASAESLVADLKAMAARVLRLVKKATASGDWRAAVAAEGELRKQLELRAKLGGQLKDPTPGAGGTTNNYVLVFEGGIPRSRPAIEAVAANGPRSQCAVETSVVDGSSAAVTEDLP